MDNLGLYLVEFEADRSIKNKVYPAGCQVNGENCRPIIVITQDECTFSANDSLSRAWKDPNRSFLRPKSKGQGMMVSEFLLPFGRLNLSSLEEEKVEERQAEGLRFTGAVEILEFEKTQDGYWNGENFLQQLEAKAILIAKALYPGYSLLFLFDNATSHAVFSDDALRTCDTNKRCGGKQAWLWDGFFHDSFGVRHEQWMYFETNIGMRVQKRHPNGAARKRSLAREWLTSRMPQTQMYKLSGIGQLPKLYYRTKM
ncbi:hypothetical protein K3495_g8683 [Podosphaera aphanis]|nr:hypothetical protein K3495_g8683 [Podosphaera aphanis]